MDQVLSDELKIISTKLRAIGHLIEAQDPDYVRPTDNAEVYLGLARILNDLSEQMKKLGELIEEREIQQS